MTGRTLVLLHTLLAVEMVAEMVAANHWCYVCIPNSGSSISDVLQMYPEGTVIPLCNQFETEGNRYSRECPSPSYQGCLTQTNGSHVTKMCTEVGIEDCKTANKIKYCYCKGDLCNSELVPTEAPEMTYDDEDYMVETGSPEDSESGQMEASSESYPAVEILREPSTTAGPPKASGGSSARPLHWLWALPFLTALGFYSHRWPFQL